MSRNLKVAVAMGALALIAAAFLVAGHFGLIPAHVASLGGAGGFLALTIPPTFAARDTGRQEVQYMRFRFQQSQVSAVSAGQKIGRLPANAFITQISWHKATAFNSATTDTLQLGSTATGVDILAATTIQGTGFVNHTAAAGLGLAVTTQAAGEIDVFAKYAQSGAAANAGDVTVVIAYTTNHDQ